MYRPSRSKRERRSKQALPRELETLQSPSGARRVSRSCPSRNRIGWATVTIHEFSSFTCVTVPDSIKGLPVCCFRHNDLRHKTMLSMFSLPLRHEEIHGLLRHLSRKSQVFKTIFWPCVCISESITNGIGKLLRLYIYALFTSQVRKSQGSY